MKAYQLIKALEEGKKIKLDYKFAFPERYSNAEYDEHVQIIELGGRRLFRYGWGSALGSEDDCLRNIFENPNWYQIIEEEMSNEDLKQWEKILLTHLNGEPKTEELGDFITFLSISYFPPQEKPENSPIS